MTLVIQAVGKTTKEMQQRCHGRHDAARAGRADGHSEPHRRTRRRWFASAAAWAWRRSIPRPARFKESGAYVIGVLGFRSKELMFWEDKFRACCDEFIVCTDDGSAGIKGLVSDGIKQAHRRQHADIDEVVAIGPPVMMKACAETTRPHGIKTMVSLNPIMVDGTGMCGGCRVKIGDRGEVRLRRRAGFRRPPGRLRRPDAASALRRGGKGGARALVGNCRMASRRPGALDRASLPHCAGGAAWPHRTARRRRIRER